MLFRELDEQARNYALHGLTQICKRALAQQGAAEHEHEAQRLQGDIDNLKDRVDALAAEHERRKVGVMETAAGPRVIYDGAGQSRLTRLGELRDELANLERAKEAHERERDAFLAVPMPGPDIVPGLADWLAERFGDQPGFRFRG